MEQPDRPKPMETPHEHATPRAVWRSDQILGRAREIVIDHGGTLYRLKITGTGKLILTK